MHENLVFLQYVQQNAPKISHYFLECNHDFVHPKFVGLSWMRYILNMRGFRIEIDKMTMVVLLSAFVEMGSLSLGKWANSQVIGNCKFGTPLVDMHAKCSDLHYANLFFDRMDVRNVWTCRVIILGLAQHDSALEALCLFWNMITSTKIRPDYVTFLCVHCAYNHACLVEDEYKYFWAMKDLHDI
ncbi:hypothetical protein SAY86_012068 [Trapa natans]|uniref:Pentatricopeptide repeat-containing protein n=1 Tax=Trapa natans TaxID=22666 RepID=A0AAN7R6P2_TRANT|nr:hypothetical protein SAY86_012068 [Trapa natans]